MFMIQHRFFSCYIHTRGLLFFFFFAFFFFFSFFSTERMLTGINWVGWDFIVTFFLCLSIYSKKIKCAEAVLPIHVYQRYKEFSKCLGGVLVEWEEHPKGSRGGGARRSFPEAVPLPTEAWLDSWEGWEPGRTLRLSHHPQPSKGALPRKPSPINPLPPELARSSLTTDIGAEIVSARQNPRPVAAPPKWQE